MIDFALIVTGVDEVLILIGVQKTDSGFYIVLEYSAVLTKIMQKTKEFTIVSTADLISIFPALIRYTLQMIDK